MPNATVIVRIDGRDFGPYPTDATGAAKVPIKVPPGMTTAKLITVVNGQTTEAPLDLKVPETRRVALFPTQAAIPGDPKASVPVRAYVVTPGGQPDAAAKVKFSVSVGTVSDAKHVGNGIYEAMWTPAAMPAGGKANLTVTLDGGAAVQTDTLEILLAPLRPGSLSVTADPTSLPAGATGFKVFTKLNALDGTGLPGREVMYVSGAARPQAASKDLKGGDYETLFVTNSGDPSGHLQERRGAADVTGLGAHGDEPGGLPGGVVHRRDAPIVRGHLLDELAVAGELQVHRHLGHGVAKLVHGEDGQRHLAAAVVGQALFRGQHDDVTQAVAAHRRGGHCRYRQHPGQRHHRQQRQQHAHGRRRQRQADRRRRHGHPGRWRRERYLCGGQHWRCHD